MGWEIVDEEYENITASEARVQRVVWGVAGLFVLASVILSAKLIQSHSKNFTKPIIQSKICGILWMVPLYATDSWLSLRFKDAALYLDIMRDCYEAYVIYLFLALMIAYLGEGSNEKVIQILNGLPPLEHPWPFNKWCSPIQMGTDFIRDCKMATMQFVIIKPLMAVVAIILQINGVYDQGHFNIDKGYLYTTLIVNASITYAFYYLVLFYLALADHLRPYNPVPKFLCIKAVLFLSFWQSVVLAFLSRFQIIHEIGSWSVENVTTGIQNLLICFEMCFVAIAHHRAFPYEQYIVQDNEPHRARTLADHLAFEDAMRDFNEVMPVVLPTHFKPGVTILKKKKRRINHVDANGATEVDITSEKLSLLTDPNTSVAITLSTSSGIASVSETNSVSVSSREETSTPPANTTSKEAVSSDQHGWKL